MPLSTNTLLVLSSNSLPNISFATNATMPSLLLVVLLLSISISACDGRHLSVHDKDSSRAFRHSSKDAALVKLNDKTSTPLKQASSEEEIPSSATMERPKGLQAPMKDVEAKRGAVSGSEVLTPSSHAGLLRTRPEVRSRVRSLIGYESNEVTVGISETRAAADLLAMDYPKPQRGPSIHNK